jgi:hypothetical protein
LDLAATGSAAAIIPSIPAIPALEGRISTMELEDCELTYLED